MYKKIKLSVILLIVNIGLSFSQMTYFTTPNYKFNTTAASLAGSPLFSGGVQGTYPVANGCYDNSNNLLFYVTDHGIYTAAGSPAGGLGYPGYTSAGVPAAYYYYQNLASTEIAIVPIPGGCKKYYVIYAMAAYPLSPTRLCYIKVDCSGGNPVAQYNGTTTAPGKPSANAAWDLSTGSTGGCNIGIAVSRIISGTGSSSIRYLYSASSSGIKYHTISSSGITTGSGMTYGVTGASYNTSELEVSPDGNWIAWIGTTTSASSANNVYIGQLSATKNSFTALQWSGSTASTAFKGLEFNATAGFPLLYLAGTNGLSYIKTSNQSQPITISSGAYDLTNTFLEMGKNGLIYGVSKTSTTQHLVGINTSNNALTAYPVTFDSRFSTTFLTNQANIYTLPDQVDGEDYTNFNGQPYAILTGMTLNNQAFTGDCDNGGYKSYYNCSPINLNASYFNNATAGSSYKIEITEYASCTPLIGPSYLNYSGPWTLGAVPVNLDLRTLTDANNNSLNTGTGVYLIKVSVIDGCGNITFRNGVFGALSAVNPVLNLEIYNTYFTNPSNTYLPAATLIANAISTGALTAGIRINGSTGSVSSYQLIIEQVDNTGAFISSVFNKTYATNNITSVSPINLNSLCIDSAVWPLTPGGGTCTSTNPNYNGYTGYFGYNNGQISVGNYYKITVTLSNACSSASNFSFIYVNNGYAKSQATGISSNENFKKADIAVFPIPAANQIKFELTTYSSDLCTIEIYDITGNKVACVADAKPCENGSTSFLYNVENLREGIYTYKVKGATINKTGKIVIAR